MKLAVVSLTNGGMSWGYRKYLVNVLPLLRQNPAVSELHVMLPAATLPKLEPVHSYANWHTWDRKSWLVGPWVRQQLNRIGADVILVPSQRLVQTSLPTVVTVQNMEPLIAPFAGNPWSETLRHLGRWLATWRACQRATRVIAISDFVRRFLVERWRLNPEKIGLVYHGVDSAEPVAENQLPAELRSLRGAEFLLSVGSIRRYRGLEDAIEALAMLADEFPRLRLVVAGEVDPRMRGYRRALQRLAEKLGVADRLVWPGFLSERVLAWCYQNCRVLVMTTRVESLSVVALEAMRNGCISVVTAVGPIPELLQQSAFYYQPGERSEMARQLRRALLLDEEHRAEMAAMVRRRAAEFTWQRTAELTMLELHKALRERPPATGRGS